MRPQATRHGRQTVASTIARPAVAATTAVDNGHGQVLQTQPAQSVTVKLAPTSRTRPRGSTRAAGRSTRWSTSIAPATPLDEQANCLATAVYFEARGESRSKASWRSPTWS